jgi:hypothetical protein
MARETIKLHAWWGPRSESVECCAERLARILDGITRSDELMSPWLWADDSILAWHPAARLEGPLLAGRLWKETVLEPMEELGFGIVARVGARNDLEAVQLNARLGAYSSTVGNVVNLRLPGKGPRAGLARKDVLLCAARAVVEASDCNGLLVEGLGLARRMQDVSPESYLGWMNYLPGIMPDDVARATPAAVGWEKLGRGVLVFLDVESFDSNDVAQMDALARAQERLAAAGIIRPGP